METVREGTETHGMTTEGKQMLSASGAGMTGLRDVDELDKASEDEDYN